MRSVDLLKLDMTYVGAFAVSLILTVVLTRFLRKHAQRLGLVDVPDSRRRVHERPVASVGGLAIFLAIATAAIAIAVATGIGDRYPGELRELVPIALGAAAMHFVGLWDDLRTLSPRGKLLLQLLVSITVFFAGMRIGSVNLPVLGAVTFGTAVSLPLTVFWFVGITNAFNLVDGADGLAGGAALLATVAMLVVALALGHQAIALFLVVIAGALLGFLHFNFPPATVFLGDSGSLFVGFLLAGLGLAGSLKTATVAAIAIPVVAFGLPVLDTALAIIRRVLRGDSIIHGDRGHIHHRLLDLGHSPRKVALILYAACAMFAVASMLMLTSDELVIGPAFVVMGIVIWFGIQRIRVPELLEVRRLIDRGLTKRHVIAGNVAIRRVCGQLEQAASLPELFRLLEQALEHTAFEEAEVWLVAGGRSRTAASGSGREAAVQPRAGDWVWTWYRSGRPLDGRTCWSVTLPIVDRAGGHIGRLSIKRTLGEDLPTELSALSEDLLPRFVHEMGRFDLRRRTRPRGQPHVAVGAGPRASTHYDEGGF